MVQRAARIVEAYVTRNPLAASDIVALIQSVHASLSRLQHPKPPEDAQQQPAISVRKSVSPGYLGCLECGQRFLSIKRHLSAVHGLSPEQYRRKWDLRSDYPMTAPNYSTLRSEIAREHGLGQDKGGSRRM